MSGVSQFAFQEAVQDFRRARQQAALQQVLARLTGNSVDLLSYEQVEKQLKLTTRSEAGVQTIPIRSIVGSVGRYADFTRTFLPRRREDVERWARVKAAFSDRGGGAGLPAIEVYQVGEVYFVLDGNHRVSVARQQGATFIEAHVIQVHTPVPLTPDVRPDDLIVKAEYADFLEETCLHQLRPDMDLSLTAPGHYPTLLAQILAQQQVLEAQSGEPASFPEAAVAWYDQVYFPMALAIRERGLLRWFPERTEADLYLWVWEHRAALEQELGWEIRPEAAVTDLAVRSSARAESEQAAPGNWRKARLLDRYSDRLFSDILVALEGEAESGEALKQAIVVARREGATLLGLHVVRSEAERNGAASRALQSRFHDECAAAGVSGRLAVETGKVVDKICERALLTDLVVLSAAHPPASGFSALGSGLRSIIWRLARPLVAVPSRATDWQRALLLYDGSPKAKEALFVAAYLGEMWKSALTVLAVADGARVSADVLDYPREYLALHELDAEFILHQGRIEDSLEIAQQRGIELWLLGGYSVSAVEELMGRSAVNGLLRTASCPLLLCR